MTGLRINPMLDPAALAEVYRHHGRLQIGNMLVDEDAAALLRGLAGSTAWKQTQNQGERILDFSTEAYQALGERGQAELARGVIAGGRRGFQFRYDTIRARDDMPPAEPLAQVLAWLNAPAMLAWLREVTGAEDIVRADAHASRYRPGHFLTTHDDHIEGRGRRAAYVLNLTPGWRPDWGGQLLFYDQGGQVARGFVPGFNMFNLFAVPQPHAVSWVTPLADRPRISITGWLLSSDG